MEYVHFIYNWWFSLYFGRIRTKLQFLNNQIQISIARIECVCIETGLTHDSYYSHNHTKRNLCNANWILHRCVWKRHREHSKMTSMTFSVTMYLKMSCMCCIDANWLLTLLDLFHWTSDQRQCGWNHTEPLVIAREHDTIFLTHRNCIYRRRTFRYLLLWLGCIISVRWGCTQIKPFTALNDAHGFGNTLIHCCCVLIQELCDFLSTSLVFWKLL